MPELLPINQVSSLTSITSRTLRHWENAGLFEATRDPQSGWRLYDSNALQCIRITDLLRRLDVPIKDIKEVITNKTTYALKEVLGKQLGKLDTMNADLEIRKQSITALIEMLEEGTVLTLDSIEDILLPTALERKKHTLTKVQALTKIQGGLEMENMKSKYGEVQFVNLPPMRTAAYSYVGVEPEDKASAPVLAWIKEKNLEGTMRLFGFNTEPYPTENSPEYGFGYCASIPEGIEIPAPLYEMRLPGGTYVVISEYEGDPSYGWKKAQVLLQDDKFEWEYDTSRHPGLEEHIARGDGKDAYYIPILIPVKKRNS